MSSATLTQQQLRLWSLRARKIVRAARTPALRRAAWHGVLPTIEHDSIPFRRDFGTVIDAGANRGQFAIFALERFPHAELHCFEPLDHPRERLQRAVGANDRLHLHAAALGHTPGTATFHLSVADDSSSLLPIGQRQTAAFPGTQEARTMDVPVNRLDAVIDASALTSPVLLKIDVQGAEFDVLQGSEAVLDRIDAMLIELSFVELYEGQALVDEVWGFLRDRRFVSRGVWSTAYDAHGECLQVDMVFAKGDFEPFLRPPRGA